MANPEIERTLKKVTEGLEIFHETLEKLDGVSSGAQKEKIEVELKKEIKKLQRLRDQIKTWQQMGDIKDKSGINEARRLIENEMERFKVLEKEMKIKAYSKEGLSQAAKLDPRELEKLKVAQWINTAVDKLGTQTDALEAELEALQIQSKKQKRLDSGKQGRLDELPSTIERHKLHVRKLEKLLRLMENDCYEPEQLNDIKDDVEYYVESNQEADFIPDESLYDQFDELGSGDDEDNEIDNEDDEDEAEDDDSEDVEDHYISRRVEKKSTTSATVDEVTVDPHYSSSKATVRKNITSSPPSYTPITSPTSTLQSPPPTSPDTRPLPLPIPSTSTSSNITVKKTSALSPSSTHYSPSLPASSPSLPIIKNMAAAIAATSTVNTLPSSFTTSPMTNTLPTSMATAIQINSPSMSAAASVVTSPPSSSTSSKLAGPSFASAILGAKSASVASLQGNKFTTTSPTTTTAKPNPYEELSTVIRKKVEKRNAVGVGVEASARNLKDLLAAIETSYAHCPDGAELDKCRSFTPSQPHPTPSYYPSQPPAILENPAIFERFELDSLFFIFYYQQRTYAQYLAARELKRQSWRFHKKYLTWFQRHEEPKTITEDYEQGTYIYFDYEGSWCQRKKSEFTFEYRFLEDEETV